MRKSIEVTREWNPVSLRGCLLYLPFYKYGANAQKIWDRSGKGYHGTITEVVPAQTPRLSNVELISNGTMESGNPPTGWTATSSPETFDRSAVQKHSGTYSARVIDSIPSQGGFYGEVPFEAGKTYKISFWYFISSGSIYLWGNGTGVPINDIELTTTGSWQYREKVFRNTDSTYIAFSNYSGSVAATFYIDDVSVQEVVGYEGLGWYLDGSNDKVEGSVLVPTSQMTALAWVKQRGNGEFVGQPILSEGGGVTYRYIFGYSINIRSLSYSDYIRTASGVTATSCTLPSSVKNKWKCFAMTFDRSLSSARLKSYLDGAVLDTQNAFNEDLTGAAIGYKVGTYDGSTFFAGNVGEILVFDRALSADEIKTYYQNTRARYGG